MKNGKDWLFTSCLVLFIFSAMRFDVGWDYAGYYLKIINNHCDRWEYISRYLCEISYSNPPIFFTLNAGVFMFGVYTFTVTTKVPNWVIIGFFIGNAFLYLNSLHFIRQYSALGIILISYHFVRNGSDLLAVLFILIASLFHYSALIFFIVFLVRSLKISFLTLHVWGVLACIAIDILIEIWISQKFPFHWYLTGITYTGAGFMNLLLLALIILGSEVFRIVFRRPIHDELLLDLKLAIFGFYLYLGLVFINYHAARIAIYFFPFLACSLYVLLIHFNFRKTILTALMIIQLGYIMYATTRDGVRSAYIPYQLWIGKSEHNLRPY